MAKKLRPKKDSMGRTYVDSEGNPITGNTLYEVISCRSGKLAETICLDYGFPYVITHSNPGRSCWSVYAMDNGIEYPLTPGDFEEAERISKSEMEKIIEQRNERNGRLLADVND